MSYILSNLLAIAAATFAGLMVGAATWRLRAEAGRSPSAGLLATALAAEFWLAAILAGAVILAPPEAGRWGMAFGSAAIIWIGFVAPTLLVTNAFHRRPPATGIADSLHWLLVMLVQAGVLQGIGLVRPG